MRDAGEFMVGFNGNYAAIYKLQRSIGNELNRRYSSRSFEYLMVNFS